MVLTLPIQSSRDTYSVKCSLEIGRTTHPNDKVFVYDMMNQSKRDYVELTSKLNDLLMFISSKCLNKKKDITSTKIDYSKVNFNSNMIEDYCNNNL